MAAVNGRQTSAGLRADSAQVKQSFEPVAPEGSVGENDPETVERRFHRRNYGQFFGSEYFTQIGA